MLANGNTIICLACQDNSRNFGNFKYLETKILKLCLLEKWREKEQEENPKYSQQIGWGWDQWEPTPGARTTVQVSSVGAPHRGASPAVSRVCTGKRLTSGTRGRHRTTAHSSGSAYTLTTVATARSNTQFSTF